MKQIFYSTTAPAKIILSGLHSVVYGKPAVTTSLSLQARAEIEFLEEDGVRLTSKNLGVTKDFTWPEINSYSESVKQTHRRFLSDGNYMTLKKLLAQEPLSLLLLAVAVYADSYPSKKGFHLMVDSDIPVGGGLGSGAAVSSACIQAVAQLFETDITLDELNRLVNQTDQYLHGRASGIDNTTVVYGETMRFWKVQGQLKFEPLKVIKRLPKAMLIDSGASVENSGELIALVRSRYEKESATKHLVEKMGKLTEEFIDRVSKGRSVFDVFQQDQRNLEDLGVVGARAKEMVRQIEAIGGVAKITGAGGVKTGSGILLACHKDMEQMEALVEREGCKSWEVELGR